MRMSYVINYYYNNGKIEREDSDSLDDAQQRALFKMKHDPNCCANILISEYDEATPNKQSIKMISYIQKDGQILNSPF